jgi:DnaJ-class molecular chaperone
MKLSQKQVRNVTANEASINFYEFLEVDPQADVHTIRQSYRRLVAIYHPSVANTGNQEMFSLLNKAWLIMVDDAERAAYNESLKANY